VTHHRNDDSYDLAPSQRWYSRIYTGPTQGYAVMSLALQIPRSASLTAVRDALAAIMLRHDILRTEFCLSAGGVLTQCLLEPRSDTDRRQAILPLLDSCMREIVIPGGLPEARAHAEKLARDQCLVGITPTAAPLFRAVLVRGTDPEIPASVLAIVFHHLAFDGASGGVFSSELSALLSTGARLAPAPSYRSFTSLSLAREQVGDDASRAHWTGELAGLVQGCHLPRMPGPLPEAWQYRLTWPAELRPIVSGAAKGARVTEFAVRAAAFLALCHLIYDSDDVMIAMPVDLRARHDSQSAIGMFVNFVPIRHSLRGSETAREFVRATAMRVAQTFRHGSYALDRIAECSIESDYAGQFPLTGALINVAKAAVIDESPTTSAMLEPAGRRAAFDFQLYFTDAPGRVDMALQFNPSIQEAPEWADVPDAYMKVLRAICESPDTILERVVGRACRVGAPAYQDWPCTGVSRPAPLGRSGPHHSDHQSGQR
jgi:Condensation domain